MTDWHDFTQAFPLEGFMPRVGFRDGRALEQALAGETLWDWGRRPIPAAVIEATYALTGPGVIKTLREHGVPYLVDPQSLRFGSPTFEEVERMTALPYVPTGALHPGSDPRDVIAMVHAAVDFQARLGASGVLTPALPLHDDSVERRLETFIQITRETVRYVGRAGGTRRPVIAVVPPAHSLLTAPDRLVSALADLPVSAFYVLPLRSRPTRDSVEKLVSYFRLVEALASFGIPIVLGRVGAFGLLGPSFGANFCESGLGEAEQFDLATLTRSRKQRDEDSAKKPQGTRRVYFEALKTTVTGSDARTMLSLLNARGRLACGLQCCRFRGFDELLSRSREHYVFTRAHEMNGVLAQETPELKLEHVHRDLRSAQENGKAIRRALEAEELKCPSFEHVDRWISVLARLTSVPASVERH